MHFDASLAILWSLFITIFWLVIGWRAMKAHETLTERLARLSTSISEIANAIKGDGQP